MDGAGRDGRASGAQHALARARRVCSPRALHDTVRLRREKSQHLRPNARRVAPDLGGQPGGAAATRGRIPRRPHGHARRNCGRGGGRDAQPHHLVAYRRRPRPRAAALGIVRRWWDRVDHLLRRDLHPPGDWRGLGPAHSGRHGDERHRTTGLLGRCGDRGRPDRESVAHAPGSREGEPHDRRNRAGRSSRIHRSACAPRPAAEAARRREPCAAGRDDRTGWTRRGGAVAFRRAPGTGRVRWSRDECGLHGRAQHRTARGHGSGEPSPHGERA